MSKLKVAIYARVSTDKQREKHTIGSQLRLLPLHAKKEGWAVVATYQDDGKSGETVEGRPGFQRLLEDAAKKRFQVLLVIDLDRITRSKRSAEGALIYDDLREAGVKLATPSQGIIDLNDEDQDFMVGIRREIAKWEKRKILNRTMRGKRDAARNGKRYGSIDPYGYKWVADPSLASGGSYQIEPSEAFVVKRMYELALEEGVNMVAWHLNQEGHRTRDIKRASRPQGGPGEWARSTVTKILKSTTYIGAFKVFKNDPDIPPIGVPPIIAVKLWERVQSGFKARKPPTKFKHDREYLIAGHARCGVCGYAMWTVNPRPGGHHRYAYYRCASTNRWRSMKMNRPCGNGHHRVDAVDDAVWTKLVGVLRDPSLLAEACALASQPEGVDWGAQAKGAERRLKELGKLESEVLRRRRRGLISATACDAELGEVARERKVVERNLRLAEEQTGDQVSRRQLVKEIRDQAALLSSGLDRATFEERRKLVGLLLPVQHGCGVTLHRDKRIEIQGIMPTPSATPVELRAATTTG